VAQQQTGDDVRGLIEAGLPLERAEAMIERLELDQEEKAALWLGAWSRHNQEKRSAVPGVYHG
jgi:hypothetical protein